MYSLFYISLPLNFVCGRNLDLFGIICTDMICLTAALEVLALVGFCEDVISDELGRAEAYMVLKRNDPGLLWLVKSSLEVSIA